MKTDKFEIDIKGDLAYINLSTDYAYQDYQDFLELRNSLPRYNFKFIEDQPVIICDKIYLNIIDDDIKVGKLANHLFDYQIHWIHEFFKMKKLALWWDTGIGKTTEELEIAKQMKGNGRKTLICCPLLVMLQFKMEVEKFYPSIKLISLREHSLEDFMKMGEKIAIVNHEYFRKERDLTGLSAFILDESSILKNENGVYGKNMTKSVISAGIQFRLTASATPAPNDWEELSTHALLLGKISTNQEFYADFFIKDKNMRWVPRAHSVEKFYRWMSGWSILMRHPEKYGFKDNTKKPPDYRLQIDELKLTQEQKDLISEKYGTGGQVSFMAEIPKDKGIVNRNKMAQISRGFVYEGGKVQKYVKTNKLEYTRNLCYNKHKDESIIIWTNFDSEGVILEDGFNGKGDHAILSGKTKEDERVSIINKFILGEIRIIITKPRILGFGLNLQHVSIMIYYGISDSYEQFYQSLRRAYRRGQTKHLNVYVPITELEQEIMANINLKDERWERLIERQENSYMEAKNA